MKNTLCRIALCLLACSASPALAQDAVLATYDLTPNGTNQAANCGNWWGSAPQTYTLDGSMDANTNAASGSEKVVVTLNGTGDQFVSMFGFPDTNAALFTNLEFDVYWNPSSPEGCWYGPYCPFYGYIEVGFRTDNSGWGQAWLSPMEVLTTDAGHWMHVVRPVDPTTVGAQVNGLILKMNGGAYGNPTSGTVTYWVDNIKLTGRIPTTETVPVLGMQKANPGLRIFAGSTVDTYDREELATVDQKQSWIGGTYPVSYSYTLLSYPWGGNMGQVQIFLIPTNSANGNSMYNNQFIDYQAKNGMWLLLNPYGGGGSVIAAVQWKTNLPNANPDHTALTITNPTAIGTWTLKFTGPNAGTLTAPNASAVPFTITNGTVVTDFTNPLVAYFGLQPNSTAGEGDYVDYASISVAGVAGVNENDNFTTDSSLNTAVWNTSCSAASSSLVLVTPDTPYWISWTLPDTGFSDPGTGLGYLGVTPDLITGSWMLPEYYNGYNDGNYIPGTTKQGNLKWTLIPSSCLPTTGEELTPNAFFKLFNPPLEN
ncbi:MAG: hypothetical protein WBN75_10175 [Verrucomicrobiia bacterium]